MEPSHFLGSPSEWKLGTIISMLSSSQLRELPKVEFHRHLDGSVRFETIVDLIKKHNLPITLSDEELFKKVKILSPMKDLKTVLDSFWLTQSTLCTYEAIKRVTFENVEDAFLDGVKLLELRFAATFIAENKPLQNDEIIEGVIDGITEGMNKYPIHVGLIHILPRSLNEAKNKLAHAAILKYKKSSHKNADRLCGFDLADSEDDNDVTYLAEIDSAMAHDLGITIHSGENTHGNSVVHSINKLKAKRIGHGIKTWNHEAAMKLVGDLNIHLEVCPTSNVLTNSVSSIQSHPFSKLFDAGISISLNSDDPHIMNLDLVHEYEVVQKHFGFKPQDFHKMNKNAIAHSFLPADIKKKIEKDFF